MPFAALYIFILCPVLDTLLATVERARFVGNIVVGKKYQQSSKSEKGESPSTVPAWGPLYSQLICFTICDLWWNTRKVLSSTVLAIVSHNVYFSPLLFIWSVHFCAISLWILAMYILAYLMVPWKTSLFLLSLNSVGCFLLHQLFHIG